MKTEYPDLTIKALQLIAQVLSQGLMTPAEVKALLQEGKERVKTEQEVFAAEAIEQAELIVNGAVEE